MNRGIDGQFFLSKWVPAWLLVLACLLLGAGAHAQTFNVSIAGPAGASGPSAIRDYTLTIENPSPSENLLNIRLTLSLAAGLELVNPAAIGCASATGAQVCNTLAFLNPMQSSVRSFQLRMPATLTSPPQQGFVIAYSASALPSAFASGGSLTAVVSVARSLVSTGSANPSPVNASGSFNYLLDLALSGPNVSWDGISIRLSVPAQIQLGQATGAGFQCSGTGSLQTCTSSIPALGQGNRSLVVPATAGLVSSLTPVVATVTASGSFLTGGALSIAQTIVPPPLDLALSKTLASASPALAGSVVRFRLGVRNLSILGGQSSTGFQVVDILPPGLSLVSALGNNWNCSGVATIVCGYTGTLAPQSDTPDLLLETISAINLSGNLTNTANLSASGDSNPLNNVASATLEFGLPTLALQKTGPANALVGDILEYSLVISNAGSAPALDVLVSDSLPPGLSLISAQGPGCSSLNPVVCRIASLLPGSAETIRIRARATLAGTVVNVANASSGPVATSASATTLVAANVDVTMQKSGPSSVSAGAAVNYTLTVSNLGESPATGVRATDVLPAGLELLSVSGAGWTCTSRPAIECSLAGPLARGASAAPIAIETRLLSTNTATQLTNSASASALDDRNASNNSDTVTTTVTGGGGSGGANSADLRLTLVPDSPSFLASGQQEISVTGTLLNLGPNPAVNVLITLGALPAGAAVQEFQVGSVNCGNVVLCNLGTLAPNVNQVVRLRIAVDSARVASLILALTAASDTFDPFPQNNAASAEIRRGPALNCCDIALSAQAPANAELGKEFTVDAVVRNLGAQSVSGASLSFSRSNLNFVRAEGASCLISEPSISCTLGGLAPGGAVSVTLVLSAIAAGEAGISLNAASEASDPNPLNNRVELRLGIERATESTINTIVAAQTDPIVQATAAAIAQVCATGSAALQAQCAALASASGGGSAAAASEVVRALLPEEILSQGASIDQVTAVQFDNIDARMSELRSGVEGFSANGLSLVFGGSGVNLGLLRSLLDAPEDDTPSIGGTGELISRWGGFVNGSYTSGRQAASTQAAGGAAGTKRDFDVVGVTAGVDYRKSANWVLGAALGYNAFDSDLADAGRLETKALTLSTYTSFYPLERLYVDARLSLGRTQMESTRRIVIRNLVDATARGKTSVSQYSVALATGYQLNRGAWNFTPNASLRTSRSNVDAFTETGAGDNSARFASQSGDSTQFSLGIQLSRALSLSRGVLLPQFDVALTRELNDQGFELDASLLGAPNVRIRTRAEAPDQSFGNAGLGLVFVTSNGRQFYLSYRRLFGADGLERGSLNLGGRFEF